MKINLAKIQDSGLEHIEKVVQIVDLLIYHAFRILFLCVCVAKIDASEKLRQIFTNKIDETEYEVI